MAASLRPGPMPRATPLQPELPLWGAAPERPAADGSEALRRVLLGDRVVHYALRRGRRRTIGLSIDHRGLRVGAPLRSTLAEIETMILRNSAWVLDKLDTWRARPGPAVVTLADGVRFPLLGGEGVLRVASGHNRLSWQGEELHLACRPGTAPLELFERGLRERARELFAERLAIHAGQMGLAAPPPLAISGARTRWGSCSRLSGIRLNFRLLHFPLPLIDYVVAHELAHLRQMNHSERFWREVELLYPDYRAARQALREQAERLPRFA